MPAETTPVDDAQVEAVARTLMDAWAQAEGAPLDEARLPTFTAMARTVLGRHLPPATTTTYWRMNGPDGPSYAIAEDHPNAEHWSRRVAATRSGQHVERREVTTYRTRQTHWQAD